MDKAQGTESSLSHSQSWECSFRSFLQPDFPISWVVLDHLRGHQDQPEASILWPGIRIGFLGCLQDGSGFFEAFPNGFVLL